MSAAFDIATLLSDLGLGTLRVNLFVNRMPDEPAAVGTVYDYGGKATDFAMGSNAAFEHHLLQIAERDKDPGACYDRAYAKFLALDGRMDSSVNGNEYPLMTAEQPPFKLKDLKADRTDTVKFVFNLHVRKAR